MSLVYPPHWEQARLQDVVIKVTSGSRDWKPYYGQGTGVFILTQNVRMRALDLSQPFHVNPPIDDPARERSAVAAGDLLVNVVGAVGTVARVVEALAEHYVCQSVALVRPAHTEVSPWLELYMSAPDGGQQYFADKTYGIGRPHLSFDDIKAMPVPLPPLDEQRALVRAVDSHLAQVDAGVRSLEDAIGGIVGYRAACLAAAFAGDWSQSTSRQQPLDELAFVQAGLAKGRPSANVETELPYIRTANVQAGYLDLDEMKTIPVSAQQRPKHRLQPHDVLVLEGGDADKVGRGWIWNGEIAECLHQNHVFAVRTKRDVLLPRFLAYYINAPQARRYFLGCAKQTVNLASINKTQLRALPVPVFGLAEQQRLLDELDRQLHAAAALETLFREQLRHATDLRRAVYREALAGSLVPFRSAKTSVHAPRVVVRETPAARKAVRKKRRAVVVEGTP